MRSTTLHSAGRFWDWNRSAEMRLLLDTHYALLLAGSTSVFTERERAYLKDPPGLLSLSAVSIWEIGLKREARHASGERKGPMSPQSARRILSELAIEWLAITPRHASVVLEVEPPQKDPFDRLLLMQAQAEGLTLLSRDRFLRGHPLVLNPDDAPS
jgi:PIN domain nuclease of toxin-antitoxin system